MEPIPSKMISFIRLHIDCLASSPECKFQEGRDFFKTYYRLRDFPVPSTVPGPRGALRTPLQDEGISFLWSPAKGGSVAACHRWGAHVARGRAG